MTYLIASDIHGSALYSEKLLSLYRKEKAERLLLLGDILYHGPRNPLPDGYEPKKVAETLSELKNEITAVRGNCDSEVDEMVLGMHILDTSAIIDTPFCSLFLTHGHIYNKENVPPLKENTVFLSGHTHIPVVEKKNGVLFLNPGSVSLPKGDSERGCIVFKDGTFTFKNLDGEIKNSVIL